MANETQVGQLVIDLRARTEALEKGLKVAQEKIKSIEEENKKLENSNKSLDASFIAMSASIVASLVKVKSAIDDGISKYKEYESANKGLESIVDGQGLSFNNAKAFIETYISDGLIPLKDATLSYKNLASRGYNEEQIKKTMLALKDAAAFGRQSTYEYGEAIATATEGLKNENSVLVDNAGVTKNVAKMWDEYAKSIGTTSNNLTQQQKIEAEVNGILEESKFQIGDAAKYAETYAGQQAQVNATNIDLSKTIGETMIPTLTQYNSLQLAITQGLTEFISSHKAATSGAVTFGITIGSLTLVFTAGTKVVQIYKTAIDTLNISSKALKVTMAGMLITSAVIAGISALTTVIQENDKAQAQLNETVETYKQIQQGTYEYTDQNISDMEKRKKDIEKQIELYQKWIDKKNEYDELPDYQKESHLIWINMLKKEPIFNQDGTVNFSKSVGDLKDELKSCQKAFEDAQKENGYYGNSLDELNEKLSDTTKYLKESEAVKKISKGLDTETIKKQQQEAAQLKINANQMQEYLDIVKKGDTSTSQYQEAIKQLAKTYPEAANAEGIMVSQAQNLIDAETLKADTAWAASQDTINSYISMLNAALQSESVQRQVAQNIGVAFENIKPKLQGVLNLLQTMAGYQATDVPNITPTTIKTPKVSKFSSSYSNKRLDNYKKEIAHKKALDQLSINQEISMYEYALRKYTKTADERNEIRERIYELNKELAKKEKEILEQQTEDYENYIQEQKNLRGSAYDVTQQTQDYNKIIQMHRNYLNQIMKDERLSLDERKEIYREELQTIRDYEQQKRDLRVEHIDSTVSHLTNAITKQLEEMQEKDKEFIDKQIEEVERLKEIRINAINEEYDAKIEAINKELETLDKAEQQKTRDEEDAEYEKKKKRLEELVAFEHDATTKANYQKELDKLLSEYQKTLDKRALEDKKEVLNQQKDLLQEEQDNKVQVIEDEVEKQKEVYEKQLEDLDKYYSEQIDKAQETAEKMLLNVEQNQNQILNLLKSYGNAYEITGQTLGEKLAQGINEGITNKIQNIIARIQNTIDANIESKIREWTAGIYKYEAGANKPQTKTVNVYQTNNIEQNPELPSETYRKLNNVSQKLAEEFAGM